MGTEASRARNAWEIQRFRAADTKAITEIAGEAEEASHWSGQSYADLAGSPGGVVLTCIRGGEVLGFAAARQTTGDAEILNVAVAQRARRQGVGLALLEAVLEEFHRAPLTEVFLEVRESNAAALALYLRFGFAVSGRRRNYYRNPTEDALCLSKKLTGVSD